MEGTASESRANSAFTFAQADVDWLCDHRSRNPPDDLYIPPGWQYMIVAFIGFTLFGVGLGFYATPSTDAALSNVPNDKAGAASGIYKMASSLGAALGGDLRSTLHISQRFNW